MHPMLRFSIGCTSERLVWRGSIIGRRLAALYVSKIPQTTVGTPLDGTKFGFNLLCHGGIAQPNEWHDAWARCYSNLLDVFYKEDMKSHGSFSEYERTHNTFR